MDVDADDEPYFVDHNTETTARCPEWLTNEQRRELARIHGHVPTVETEVAAAPPAPAAAGDLRAPASTAEQLARPATSAGNVCGPRSRSSVPLALLPEETQAADDQENDAVFHIPSAAAGGKWQATPRRSPLGSASLGASPVSHSQLNTPSLSAAPKAPGNDDVDMTASSPPSPAQSLPTYHEHCAAQLAEVSPLPDTLRRNSEGGASTAADSGVASHSEAPSPFECPKGWQRHVDDSTGEPYYVHRQRQRVSWTHPGLCLAIYNIALEDLPPAWDVGIDVRGLYFVNHVTQHTQRRVPVVLSALTSELSSAIAMSAIGESERGENASLSSSLSDALDTLSLGASSVASAVSGALRSLGTKLWPQSPDLPRYHDHCAQYGEVQPPSMLELEAGEGGEGGEAGAARVGGEGPRFSVMV